MQKKRIKRIKNSTLIVFFFLFVILCIIIASIIHVVILISQSTYDNRHQFILGVKERKQERILVFNPDTNTLNDLVVKGFSNNDIPSLLDIPIDATVVYPNSTDDSVSSLLLKLFLHCNTYKCQGLNEIDVLKLYFYVQNIQINKIKHAVINIPFSQKYIHTVIPIFFTDSSIYNEALTISITNATGEDGMGNILATLLSNIGGNVISVTSEENKEDMTTLKTTNENSYSIIRFKKILSIKRIVRQIPEISDIMIIIGKNHPEF